MSASSLVLAYSDEATAADAAVCIGFEMKARRFDRYLVARSYFDYPVDLFWFHRFIGEGVDSDFMSGNPCQNTGLAYYKGLYRIAAGEAERTYMWFDERLQDMDGSINISLSDTGGEYEYGACQTGRRPWRRRHRRKLRVRAAMSKAATDIA